MEKALFQFSTTKERKLNPFYELCKLAADIQNRANGTTHKPNRYYRDCKLNLRAWELTQIDYSELKHYSSTPKEHAKLFFGLLKRRKQNL